MYSKTCPYSWVNEARKDLFAQRSRTMENITPIQAALLRHLKRATFQAGHVRHQALVAKPVLPDPSTLGGP